MKKNIYRWIGWAAAAMLTAQLSASCGTEPILEVNEKAGDALMISPALLDMQGHTLRTRALSEDDLKDTQYNENKVNRLDVFFFKASDGTLAQAYHIETTGSPESHGDVTGYLLSNDWSKDNLEKNVAYKIYIVANSTNVTVTEATSGVTLADLQALTVEDADIYKRFKNGAAATDVTYTASKAFLMNAQVDWTITESGTQLVSGDKITLTRAAVKFVMDVSLSPEFAARLTAAGEQYGAPSWKFVNFNKVSAEVPGGTIPAAALMTAGSSNYLEVEQGTGDQAGHFTVVTYAYPQTWTAATMSETAPAIFLSFPSRPIGSPTATPAYHYYYIPICSQSTTATVSNNLYKVNAVISSFGSSEVITSDPVNLNYEVMPWGSSYTADIEAVAHDYILATPSRYTFKGGPVGEFIFTNIKYYASGKVEIDDNSISGFYINKDGKQIDLTKEELAAVFDVSYANPNETSRGQFKVESKVPTNGTYREVHFTVKCGNKTQEVKIRHYPLDFITAKDGSYSTYQADKWVSPNVGGSYASSLGDGDNNRFYFVEGTGGSFNAKERYGGELWNLGLDGSRANQDYIGSDLTNNQMYVLQITSADEAYTIGRPTLEKNYSDIYRIYYDDYWGEWSSSTNPVLTDVPYSTSSDDVLSPAFMLASQLGANRGFPTATLAAIHCALYKEVANGKEYTGWRLPTKQEVDFMIKYQYKYTTTMDEVLSGHYYWTLDGRRGENSQGDNPGNTYTRCVRDLTAEELEEINKFE